MFCLKENPWDQIQVESLKPDGHGAEDVEEDEAAVSHVVSQKVSMAQSLSHKNCILNALVQRQEIFTY